jgi:hypothetical protein
MKLPGPDAPLTFSEQITYGVRARRHPITSLPLKILGHERTAGLSAIEDDKQAFTDHLPLIRQEVEDGDAVADDMKRRLLETRSGAIAAFSVGLTEDRKSQEQTQ